eukprot:299674_1
MSDSDSGTGIIISIVYGTCHLILLLILCIKMYHNSMKANDKISIRKFAWSLWKQRGIYSPVIIHIYDTATDIGVLYEWYKLAQMEKNGERELKSLDMEQFFWVGIGFMIAYRVIAAFYGAFLRLAVNDDYSGYYEGIVQAILGIFLGLFELTIFASIYADYKENKDKAKSHDQAGPTQKIAQLMEGVLESLPEVVMQSVFLMRALNDDYLKKSAGDIKELVIFSIFASLLSITNKYVWMDEFMILHNARSMFVTEKTKDDALKCSENKDHDMVESAAIEWWPCTKCGERIDEQEMYMQCTSKCSGMSSSVCLECRDYIDSYRDAFVIPLCVASTYISYGYVIRVTWRLCAVLSRFIIFALIWVVLGGAFEIILIPIMMIVWYIIVICMASYGNSDMARAKRNAKSTFCRCDDVEECCQSCCVVFAVPLGFILMGFVFQMGILGLAGRALYFIRVIENLLLMSLISVFAFMEFDCDHCADATERSADNNPRIMGWVVAGWISVGIHCILSFIMPNFIADYYKGDIHKLAQEFYETQQKLNRKRAGDKQQTQMQMSGTVAP